MLYKHKDTSKLYRVVCESFDVQTQRPHCVYMQLETGFMFNRDKEFFLEKFEMVEIVQAKIIPNPPAPSEKEMQEFIRRTQEIIMSDNHMNRRTHFIKMLDDNEWRTVRDIPFASHEDVIHELTMYDGSDPADETEV